MKTRLPGRVYIVCDPHFGDAAKSRVLDYLLADSSIRYVLRANGGANAGHRVTVGDKSFAFHLIPSGVFTPGVTCLIGSNVVIDPMAYIRERKSLEEKGISLKGRLWISYKANLTFPWHKLEEELEEQAMGDGKVDTTKKGIGTTYAEQKKRWRALTMGDTLFPDAFLRKSQEIFEYYLKLFQDFYGLESKDVRLLKFREEFSEYQNMAIAISPLVKNTDVFLFEKLEKGEKIMIEGAQGGFLDNLHGTFPYVTSSGTTIPGLLWGSGLGFYDQAYVVLKAITTRVGNGTLVGELFDRTGEKIREAAHEYGETTGRPRRCSWFDAVVANAMLRLQYSPYGEILTPVTKLDVLDSFETVKIIKAYKHRNQIVEQPPLWKEEILRECEPVYEELPGWQKPTIDLRHWDELPKETQGFLKRIHELTFKHHIPFATVGAERSQTVVIPENAFL